MYLRERDGERIFPIIIAPTEMAEIHRKVHGVQTRRPMTHDLFASLVQATKLELERIEITELKSEVFYARMHFTGPEGDLELDARPSDAVALATGLGSPIFANEAILDEIGVIEDGEQAAGEES
jgi:hypothetical protein